MKRSDMIFNYILSALTEGGGIAEMQRGAIAREFGCVPSQITYVLDTRFTPENGYQIETRRGEGGYIRIIRRRDDPQQQLADFASALPEQLEAREILPLLRRLQSFQLITAREAALLSVACSDGVLQSLPVPDRNRLRAEILRVSLHRLTL